MAADPLLRPGETLDDLRLGGLRIIQKKDGYRLSLDPVLLCAFAHIRPAASVCDLGCGSGVIPLILARTSPAARIVGLEIQQQLAERAARSVLLNRLQDRVEVLHQDVRQVQARMRAGSFDVVLANPPYRRPCSGRIAPRDERARARHELDGALADFLAAGAYLLGSGGRFFLVHLAERLVDLLGEMRCVGLEPKRLRCVHSRAGEAARLVLVEGRRDGAAGLAVLPPLFIYEGSGYSAEVMAMYGEG